MLNGATQVLFEGVPTYPDAGRAWDIVDKYKVHYQSHVPLLHAWPCVRQADAVSVKAGPRACGLPSPSTLQLCG